ncbi:DUF4358 domain-containing protein [Sporosarcina siberiensis]|uniref:DUF4358 domain-containing protein n=1 Tax=Sporosarcina siberiensis TaxID=1365606 RepID=A0ABW4SGK7_9BACL
MRKLKVMTIIMFLVLVAGCTNQPNNDKEDSDTASFDTILVDVKEQIAQSFKDDGVEEEVLVDGKLTFYWETDLTASEESDPAIAIWVEKMGLNKEEIVNGTVIAAMMNVNADEIILLEAKDEKDVASLKSALEKELEGQIQTWKQYLPDQLEKVENNIITTNGKYLMYITYSNPEKIEKIFKDSF